MLQLIAILTMIIDHIGVIYEISIFRIIGRVCMPLYAYFVYRGMQYTHNKVMYVCRIGVIALFSQLPFLRFGGSGVNICFSWMICGAVLYFFGRDKSEKDYLFYCIMTLCAGIFILIVFPVEYSILPLLWCLFWFYKDTKRLSLFLLAAVIFVSLFYQYQLWSIIAIFVVDICKHYKIKERLPKNMRYLWRYFYPLQYYVLGCFK